VDWHWDCNRCVVPPWVPRGDKTYCTTHDEEFPRGRVCPVGNCRTGAVVADERPKLDATGLPTTIDHERWFVEISDELHQLAQETGEDGPSANERVKAYDGAIKARRAAVECARRREDWEETERLERAVHELHARRDPARVNTPSAQGPVRH